MATRHPMSFYQPYFAEYTHDDNGSEIVSHLRSTAAFKPHSTGCDILTFYSTGGTYSFFFYVVDFLNDEQYGYDTFIDIYKPDINKYIINPVGRNTRFEVHLESGVYFLRLRSTALLRTIRLMATPRTIFRLN